MSQGICLMTAKFWWTLSLKLTPWIWCTCHDSSGWEMARQKMRVCDEEAAKGKPAKPLMILCNHTSFFDSIINTIFVPPWVLWRSRTYIASHLLAFPVLSTMCTTAGFFVVWFHANIEGNFQVDIAKQEAEELKVAEHIKNGGWLIFYPEGTINRDPDKMLPFRYGGIKKALEFDARLVINMAYGNAKVWPKKAMFGGFPAHVRYACRSVAPDGCVEMLRQIRAGDLTDEEKEMPDHVLLANRVHAKMQALYDEMKSAAVEKAS